MKITITTSEYKTILSAFYEARENLEATIEACTTALGVIPLFARDVRRWKALIRKMEKLQVKLVNRSEKE